MATSGGTKSEEKAAGSGIKGRLRARWTQLKEQHVWLRHVVDAYALMQRNNGNQYAAAITYFSFLAFFPLLLLAVSVTGFVLHAHPHTQQELFNHITNSLHGDLGRTVKSSLQSAINARAGVGLVGLVGVLLTGLGWIANLRGAIDGVWGRPPAKRSFLKAKIADLLVLGGLGIGLLVSIGLTTVGTSLTHQIVSWTSLDDVPGMSWVLKVVGIAIGVAADLVIFWWVLVRLPQADVARGVALRGALMASIGFEVLKIAGSYTIAHSAHSPTAGPFAVLLAVLVWIQLVARWLLFCCAWMATIAAEDRAASQARADAEAAAARAAALAAAPRQPEPVELGPAAVGATLVGAGAVMGAAAYWAATRDMKPRSNQVRR